MVTKLHKNYGSKITKFLFVSTTHNHNCMGKEVGPQGKEKITSVSNENYSSFN